MMEGNDVPDQQQSAATQVKGSDLRVPEISRNSGRSPNPIWRLPILFSDHILKGTMSNSYLCLLLAGLCVFASCHHVPGHQGGHDGHEHPTEHPTPTTETHQESGHEHPTKDPPTDETHQESGHEHPTEHPTPTTETHQESGHLPCFKITTPNAEFAFKYYRQLASESGDKNIFFSPLCISTAFMLVSLGTPAGTPVEEIVSGLGFNQSLISVKEMHGSFHHLLQLLNRPNAQIELSIGNALFSTDRFPLKREVADKARDLFYAEMINSNFQNADEAVNQINSYIENKTHGKLVKVLKSLDPDTVMVLVSYLFLKGYWEKPFDPESTRKRDFFINNETIVQVDMMHRDGYYHTFHDEELGCKVVQVPYQGNASALFILPDKGKLSQVEQGLKPESVLKWESCGRPQRIDLSLPKVTLKTSHDVKEIAQRLGIKQVFTDQADLSAFTGQPNLKISEATHKAYLNIHENGTEAAATTVIEIVPTSLPPQIKFDSPYLVLIVDHFTRAILFMGKIMNPNDP